ncbi:uncharacterized protein LOC125471500 [Pyrus x bretschneideri]|uniref:uncharacterized protein LOC125471500 n=1 Tax=Pyrus x bretschneideri TaxID=225117 RepID=UPI00202F4BC4|nr:uncharacterized protein LOC125471500 [Pyrus x bretschneideri]
MSYLLLFIFCMHVTVYSLGDSLLSYTIFIYENVTVVENIEKMEDVIAPSTKLEKESTIFVLASDEVQGLLGKMHLSKNVCFQVLFALEMKYVTLQYVFLRLRMCFLDTVYNKERVC